MSKLPGNPGYSVLGDKSLEFYKDPVGFCDHRLDKHGGGGCRVFQSRLLNKPTAFVCSVRGMRELLHGKNQQKKPRPVYTLLRPMYVRSFVRS